MEETELVAENLKLIMSDFLQLLSKKEELTANTAFVQSISAPFKARNRKIFKKRKKKSIQMVMIGFN